MLATPFRSFLNGRVENKERIAMRSAMIALFVICAAAQAPAAAAAPAGSDGTVNASTPAMLGRARQAAEHAGYHPIAIAAVQDGNVFLNATRDNQVFEITFTRAGKLFVSTGLPLSGN